MGEPIKIVVTAQTQQAAAALQDFCKTQTAGLKAVGATDQLDAVDKATKLANFLNYKVGARKSFPFNWEDVRLEPREIAAAFLAKQIGLFMHLFAFPIGADEAQIFGYWPFLVPPINQA